jgi:NADPH-dependent ferric siderophore reductase
VSTRARQHDAKVLRREQLSPHLVRLTLAVDGFVTTGVPDEWVGLVVPGQFQVRYYTVRSYGDGADGRGELVLEVVVHEVGLVTEWASTDCVGDSVVVTEPKGSFELPDDAEWLMLVGDLTALPAMARIAETVDLPTRIWAQVPDAELHEGYLPARAEVTWLDGRASLADVVASLDWPDTTGYFWMAGESADMRAIRKHLMRDRKLPATTYDVMGYWRRAAQRQPRAVDPGPIYRAGKAQGLSDEEIWARYDEAQRQGAES